MSYFLHDDEWVVFTDIDRITTALGKRSPQPRLNCGKMGYLAYGLLIYCRIDSDVISYTHAAADQCGKLSFRIIMI